MALQKRFNNIGKQFVDCKWTIISGLLSHGRGRSKLTLDRRGGWRYFTDASGILQESSAPRAMNTQSGILCDPASLVLLGRCQASSRHWSDALATRQQTDRLLNSCPIKLFLDIPTILGRAAETKHSTESNSSFIRSSRRIVVRAEGFEPSWAV